MVINWDFSVVSDKFIGLNVEAFRNGKGFSFLSFILVSLNVEGDDIVWYTFFQL